MSLSRQTIIDLVKQDVAVLQNVLVIYLQNKYRVVSTRRVRRFGVNPVNVNRNTQGFYNNLVSEMRLTSTEAFANYHRMNPQAFDELLAMVGPLIEKIHVGERSITAGQRLSLTLR